MALSNKINDTVTFRTDPEIRAALRAAFRGLIDAGHFRANQSDVIKAAILEYAKTFPRAVTTATPPTDHLSPGSPTARLNMPCANFRSPSGASRAQPVVP